MPLALRKAAVLSILYTLWSKYFDARPGKNSSTPGTHGHEDVSRSDSPPTAIRRLSLLQQFGAIFACQRLRLCDEGGLLGFAKFRWRGGARRYQHPGFHKKLFQAGGRANANQARRLIRSIVELVRSVRWNTQRLASSHGRLLAAEGRLHLAVEHHKRLFEIMSVRRRSPARRHVHIDHTEPFGCIFPGHKKGVGVADHSNMRQLAVLVFVGNPQTAAQIVWRQGGK